MAIGAVVCLLIAGEEEGSGVALCSSLLIVLMPRHHKKPSLIFHQPQIKPSPKTNPGLGK
jgi:hypothetical protein